MACKDEILQALEKQRRYFFLKSKEALEKEDYAKLPGFAIGLRNMHYRIRVVKSRGEEEISEEELVKLFEWAQSVAAIESINL